MQPQKFFHECSQDGLTMKVLSYECFAIAPMTYRIWIKAILT